MGTLIGWITGKALPWIIAIGGGALALLGYGAAKKRAGKKEGRAEIITENRRATDEAQDREDRVKPTGKRDASKRLRDGKV